MAVASPADLEANPCNGGGHLATQLEADSVTDGSIIAGYTFICNNDKSLGISNKVGEAKNYLVSVPKRPLSNCAPPNEDNIRKLNDTFAVCAANFIKAYTQKYPSGVYITSAYRDAGSGANQCAGGAAASNHTRGLAIDMSPVNGDWKTLWNFASQNPKFGVCFPFQDKPLSGYPNGDKPHIILAGIGGTEGSRCAAQGVASPCDGVPFDPKMVTAQGGATARGTGAGTTEKPVEYRVATDDYDCLKYRVSGTSKVCIDYAKKSSSNGLFSSLFGGSNTDMGKMMQMMMGMQLGQGLGSVFGNLFGSSNSTANTQPSYGSTPYPTQPATTNTTQTTTKSTDSINDLMDALGDSTNTNTSTNTNGTSSITVTGGDVGQVTEVPKDTDGTSFITPLSGAAPLIVMAKFSSGTPCSDAYELSWGDGAKDAMIYTPPSGGACSMLAQANNIPHTYTQPGTYAVSLKQGPSLSSVRTASVIVIASSTSGGDVPPPSISGSSSTMSTSALENLLNSIGRTIVNLGNAMIQAVTP